MGEELEALKLGRHWAEWVSLQCGYHGCTPDTCSSKKAELDLVRIDAAISAMQSEGVPND